MYYSPDYAGIDVIKEKIAASERRRMGRLGIAPNLPGVTSGRNYVMFSNVANMFIDIYTLSGERITTLRSVGDAKLTLSTTGFPAGAYLAKISCAGRNLVTRRINIVR